MISNTDTTAVVIVNFRTPDMTIDLLESLINQVKLLSIKVLIVDNNSEDNSVDLISRWINTDDRNKYFTLIVSQHNLGFAGGNNLAINSFKAEHYILLNSDTIIRDEALDILIKTAKSKPEVGIIGPRLEWLDAKPQESCFNFHTIISEFLRTANIGLLSNIFSSQLVARPVSSSVQEYNWVSFACVLIKSQVFDEIGLLDDEYFMYFEDVEFCYRATKRGWKIIYQPDAHIVHLRGGSSPLKSLSQLRKRLPRYFFESRTRYFYSLYGWWGLLGANVAWMLGAAFSKIRDMFTVGSHGIIAKAQWRDIWVNFTKPLSPYIHPNDYD